MVELVEYKLMDVAESQTGPFGSQLHESDYVEVGTPIVTVEHLGEVEFSSQNLPLVSDEDKMRLSKYVLKKGDIVFSRVGSVDRCTYVSEKEDGWMFSGRCIRVRCNEKVNSRFINFYFRQRNFKKMMVDISVGATMPSLNTSLMNNIPLYLPSKNIQNKVADILSTLDEKISLNNQINTELGTMAKTIYNYWFVQFDFPDEEGKPYKTSGGEMEWNEELKRDIPKGWNVGNLASSEITSVIDTGVENYQGDKIYLSTSEIEGTEIINHSIVESFSSKPSRANMQPCYNSIWFARMKDTKKVLLLSDYCSEIVNNYILSTGFAGLKTPKEALYYLWNFINDNHLEEIKNKYAT